MRSKAIFLLIIFVLNTVIGFGCTLALEGNNHEDSHDHTKSVAHVHKDHNHSDGHEHLSKEDPCCKTLVNDLITQSKLVPEMGKVQVVLPVMWLPDYSYASLISVTDLEINQSVFADHKERPPNQDIRITIQSFQI